MALAVQQRLKDNHQVIVEMYDARQSLAEIARVVGVTKETLRKYMDNNNLRSSERRGRSRYRLNENALDQADNATRTMWTRLIADSAYVVRDSATLIVETENTEFLERLRQFLDTDRPFEPIRGRYRLRVRSKRLWSIIADWKAAHQAQETVSNS